MSAFSSAMQQAKNESLVAKNGIAKAFLLQLRYENELKRWNRLQSLNGNRLRLWNLTGNLLKQSRTQKWKNTSGLPSNSDLRGALGITSSEKYEQLIDSQADSQSEFIQYGQRIDEQRQRVEAKANDLRNYLLYGSEDIQKASEALPLEKQPFFTAFRDLDYKNQLRTAVKITDKLRHTLVGKQLLSDLLYDLPFRFVDFFYYPARDLPDYTLTVSNEDLTSIKPLAGEYVQSGSPGKLKKEFNPVVDNLMTLANQLMPGLVHRLTRNPDDGDVQADTLRTVGRILYPFFDSANVFDESEVRQHLSDTTPENLLGELAAGGINWSEVPELVPAYVGNAEKVISNISEETDWATAGNIVQQRAIALKGLFAVGGAVMHAANTVYEYNTGNYDWQDFGENFVVLAKTVADSTAVARALYKVGSKKIDKLLGVVGIIFDAYDTVMTLWDAYTAYQRNNISVAAGLGVAGIGTIGSGIAFAVAAGSGGIGWTVAGVIGVAMALSGLTFASLTGPSPVLKWVKWSGFGNQFGSVDDPKPTKMYYDYQPEQSGDTLVSEARMTGTFYGFKTDATVTDVATRYDPGSDGVSQLIITLDDIVINSATDVVVQPIVNEGDGEYTTGPVQHVFHLSDATHVSRTPDPPPFSTEFKEAESTATLDKPSKWMIHVTEDINQSNFDIEDLLGIGAGDLSRSGHYLEIGIVPSSLSETSSSGTGPTIQASTPAAWSKAYNRLPTMVRHRKEISPL